MRISGFAASHHSVSIRMERRDGRRDDVPHQEPYSLIELQVFPLSGGEACPPSPPISAPQRNLSQAKCFQPYMSNDAWPGGAQHQALHRQVGWRL